MNILKRIFLVLLVLFFAGVIIGFIMPAQRHIERSVMMKASPEAAFAQVNELKNWPNWSPWQELDPGMKMEYSTPSAGKDAFYTWSSDNKKVGHGKMTISDSSPSSQVNTLLEFEGMTPASGGFTFAASGDSTKVTWFFDMNLGKNPFARLFGPMIDKELGEMFDSGLAKMRTAASKS